MASRSVVAIINTSPDTIELLSGVLEAAGFVVISGYTHDIRSGKLNLVVFLQQHAPRVIVYDIAPPYERNYRLFEHVRSMACAENCRFVLTSTNAAHVQKLARRDERVFEVVDKPVDLDLIVTAVKEAALARPTR
jgi:CheY-like chemotaxis protein